jgi:thioredoxin reductase (NADPH)
MVRGPKLAASMSRYLEDRITANPVIEVMTETEVVALEGSPEHGLERVRWRSRGGPETTSAVRSVFVFTGADPSTAWLEGAGVERDAHGFVITGAGDGAGAGGSPFASSVPGVFAIGDVRLASVKGVGAAIGEGASVVAAVHAFLDAGARSSADVAAARARRTATQA